MPVPAGGRGGRPRRQDLRRADHRAGPEVGDELPLGELERRRQVLPARVEDLEDAPAEAGGWDRAVLECPLGVPGRVRPV